MVAEKLAMPVFLMKQVLSRNEYHSWVRHITQKQPDETEIQLAVLTHIVAQGLGHKGSKVDDYLINKPKKQASNGLMTSSEVSSIFGGVSLKG